MTEFSNEGVWKYELLGSTGRCEIELPHGAEVVHVGLDPRGRRCLWARIKADAPPERRCFAILGTGQVLMPGDAHLGTWVEGEFVWHLFERARAAPPVKP